MYLAHVCFADAADDEGKCVKAELDILRTQARRNAHSLAQHLPCSVDLPSSETLAMQMHGGMQSNKAATVCLSEEPEQSTPAANQLQVQEGQDHRKMQDQGQSQGQMQRQGQRQMQDQGQMQDPGQGLGQRQGQGQSSGGRSEAELAAVEQGLSVLEQQITAAALRCASQIRQCYVVCMCVTRTMLCATVLACCAISFASMGGHLPGMLSVFML